ncbi:MAG TPA: putative solute-binding protein [Dongiaceae bacterium]|nr:putative solute-binding protein [Dongiaceae bacterium]
MKKILKSLLVPFTIGALGLSVSAQAAEPLKATFCIWDIVGKNGPVYTQMEDYRLEALKWGVDLQMKAYTDEKIAAEDFKAGVCDAVGVSGLRGRQFNPFTGTLDSIGAIPTDEHMKTVLQYLADPKLGKLMVNGDYEVAGIGPAGSAFLFTKDRTIDSVGELAGKKFAVLDFDKTQAIMVESIGGSPITASITNFGSLFNNGTVDIIGAPAVAYDALELYKGLGPNGAIVNFSLIQLTVQVIIRKSKFPEGYGQKSREFVWSQYPRFMEYITAATKNIKPSYWLDVPEKDKPGYLEMFRQSRIKLRNDGFYDGKMLSFLSKVRCQKEPSLAECTAKDRE